MPPFYFPPRKELPTFMDVSPYTGKDMEKGFLHSLYPFVQSLWEEAQTF